MNWTSAIAIYALFWVLAAFLVLPFGIRPHNQTDLPMVPGQVESAPTNFRPLRVVAVTTLVAAIAFGAFYANYVYGWITIADIDVFGSQERFGQSE